MNKEDLLKPVDIRLNHRLYDDAIVVNAYSSHRMGDVTGLVVTTVSKQIVNPEEKSFLPMIKVYPNPVQSGTNINVGCQKLKEGYYAIQLTNQAGQQVLSKQTWIDGDTQVLNVDIPHVATGIYFLKLTNKETSKRFTQKIIVE
jgi:hypothetical protein